VRSVKIIGQKAQVSLEFLVLAAAFLAFLAAWLPVIAKVKGSAESGAEAAYLQEAAARIAGALDSVCLMGEGNVRVVEIRLARDAKLELTGRKLFLVAGGNAVEKDLRCEAEGAGMVLEDGERLEVRWKDGRAVLGTHQ